MGKLILLPFFTCLIAIIFRTIFNLCHKPLQAAVCEKIYLITFFLLWFGFLIFTSFTAIREHQFSLLLFMIPFWIAGFFAAKKTFFKKE